MALQFWCCDNTDVTCCSPTEAFLHTECNNGQCLLSGPLAVISSDYHLLPRLKGPLSSPSTDRPHNKITHKRQQKGKHKCTVCNLGLMNWENQCCSAVQYSVAKMHKILQQEAAHPFPSHTVYSKL